MNELAGSAREQALVVLTREIKQVLEAIEPGIKFDRNKSVVDRLDEDSPVAALMDGEVVNTEPLLGCGNIYHETRQAAFELLMKERSDVDRDARVDQIWRALRAAVQANPRLDGAADFVEVLPPDENTDQVEGMPGVKALSVPITLWLTIE